MFNEKKVLTKLAAWINKIKFLEEKCLTFNITNKINKKKPEATGFELGCIIPLSINLTH